MNCFRRTPSGYWSWYVSLFRLQVFHVGYVIISVIALTKQPGSKDMFFFISTFMPVSVRTNPKSNIRLQERRVICFLVWKGNGATKQKYELKESHSNHTLCRLLVVNKLEVILVALTWKASTWKWETFAMMHTTNITWALCTLTLYNQFCFHISL